MAEPTAGIPSVEVRLLDPRVVAWGFPHWGSSLAAGLDLFACLDAPLTLKPGDPAQLVRSGIAIHIGDADWVGLIYPRSGAGHRGLILGNGVGVIDADYQGEIMVSAWNRNADVTLTIVPGERVAQLLFTRVVRPALRIVPSFSSETARKSGGFGSTGA